MLELQEELPMQQGSHPPVVPPTVHTADPMRDEQAEFTAAAERAFSDKPAGTEPALDGLSAVLMGEFQAAVQLRQPTEERWLKDLRQFRGVYEPETLAKLENRSQSFVRRTRVKVVTTDSRMMDYLFPAGSEKNWSCDSTPTPSVSDEFKSVWAQRLAQRLGRNPSEQEIDEEVLAQCKLAAKGMTKVIDDQLVETRYKQVTRKALHSGNLYGTGIIKGPLVEKKIRQRFMQEDGKWQPKNEEYIVPFVDFVPLWRFYPDMAATELDQCRFVYELHLMTRHHMAGLIERKTFKGELIKAYLEANPNGAASATPRPYENELKALGERDATQSRQSGMYEVLERWGWLTGLQLRDAGVKIEANRLHESFFSNVWLLPDGQIIKAVLQPINGVTWPYHIYYFDKDETSIFGEGLASIMRDDQEMLNAAIRMMLDNGALTSGPMLEIALSELAVTERADEVFPWKIWYRKNAADLSKPAIRQIQLENNLEWLSKMASMFETNSDEVTAIPRYMSGENATTGAAGTAQGMSMLMGAANIVVKELLNSWDEGITRGFIQSLYRWNMQFNNDNSIKGDFDVKARGTASLIAKEVRTRQLNDFALGPAAQPQFAPFVKPHKLLLSLAEAAEMSDVVKTEDEVKAEAESEQGKKLAEMQAKLQEAQLAQEVAKAAKMSAEAEVAMTKVKEMLANISLIVSTEVSKKVETIFAALQAGGVATRDPLIAPAGDEILRSAGYRDETPDPTIAQLNGPPVQQAQSTQRVMARGEGFAADPRVPGTVQPEVQQAAPGPAPGAVEMPDANIGQRAGIKTARIE